MDGVKSLVTPVLYGDLMGVAGLMESAKSVREALAAQLSLGEVQSAVEFSAVVFRQGPNRNHLRFYDEDLPAFAASFAGVPFLGDHNQREVSSRYGTVLSSHYDPVAREMVQTLRMTRSSAIQDFAGGLIDRFSIGWDYEEVICSITGGNWFESPYWPGQRVKQADGTEKVCELYFVKPVGVETSAVNVPAVEGTRVLSQLAAARDAWQAQKPTVFATGGMSAGSSDGNDKQLDGEFHDEEFVEEPVEETDAEPREEPREKPRHESGHESVARLDGGTIEETLDTEMEWGGTMNETVTGAETQPAPTAVQQMGMMTDAVVHRPSSSEVVAATLGSVEAAPVLAGADSAAAQKAEAYLQVFAQQVVASYLSESGLSERGKAVVHAQLGATPAVEEIERAIVAQKHLEESIRAQLQVEIDAQAAAMSAQTAQVVQYAVKGMTPIDGGKVLKVEDEIARVQSTLDWLMGDPNAPVPSPEMRSLRDLYLWMTKDYEWRAAATGWTIDRWDGARLAAGSVANLPNMLVESLNRVLIDIYNEMAQYRWYEPLVSIIPHDGSTRTVDMITWNEVANLPVVGEGEPYREAELGDAKEQLMFDKLGMWIGLTLEMIRKNDLMSVREVPRKLMRAAVRTRSSRLASIWTRNSGTGPVMSDGKPLFHTDHQNLGDEAFSHAAWTTVRQRAFKQAQPGSGARLGFMPEFLLIPIDLLETVMTTFGYGTGDVGKPTAAGTAQEVNIYALTENRPKIIPVPEWLDATDWAWMVSPRFVPAVQMAFANLPNGGKSPMPEIFAAERDTEGLMFSNDTLPIKIRDWYGIGIASHLGIGKQNVAG